MRLPKELQLEILKLTDLVDPRDGDYRQSALWVTKGTESFNIIISNRPPNRHYRCKERGCEICKPQPGKVSPELLYVNKQLEPDVSEIYLGRNRLVLFNGHDSNLEYLKLLPPLLRCRIRHLHLRFNERYDFAVDEEELWCCVINNPHSWDRLITWIAENLSLPILHLTIDLGESYSDINAKGGREEFSQFDAAVFARAYRRIAQPLSKLKGLRKCFVFLACNFRMEAEMEKIATGNPHYNSFEDDKVPPISRHFQLPHAWPPEEIRYAVGSHGWRMWDYAEEPSIYWVQSIEEYTSGCLHKDWWVDVPLPPVKRPTWMDDMDE